MAQNSLRALAVLLTASVAACVDDSKPASETGGLELFAAFKTFCVDTEANPDAVKVAVETAGGTLKTKFMDRPTGTVMSWDLAAGNHRFSIVSGIEHVPASPTEQGTDSKHCFIDSHSNEDVSLAAIRNWVAVPPTQAAANVTVYSYQIVGSARMAMNLGTPETRRAKIEGRERMLALIRNSDSASVQLNYYRYGPVPPGFIPSR